MHAPVGWQQPIPATESADDVVRNYHVLVQYSMSNGATQTLCMVCCESLYSRGQFPVLAIPKDRDVFRKPVKIRIDRFTPLLLFTFCY